MDASAAQRLFSLLPVPLLPACGTAAGGWLAFAVWACLVAGAAADELAKLVSLVEAMEELLVAARKDVTDAVGGPYLEHEDGRVAGINQCLHIARRMVP